MGGLRYISSTYPHFGYIPPLKAWRQHEPTAKNDITNNKNVTSSVWFVLQSNNLQMCKVDEVKKLPVISCYFEMEKRYEVFILKCGLELYGKLNHCGHL